MKELEKDKHGLYKNVDNYKRCLANIEIEKTNNDFTLVKPIIYTEEEKKQVNYKIKKNGFIKGLYQTSRRIKI